MDVATFERKVFEVDGVAIRIRAPLTTNVAAFTFVRAATGKTTMAEWRKTRISPLLGHLEYDCIFVGVENGTFHANATLGKARTITSPKKELK